jgi:hypothetical protein
VIKVEIDKVKAGDVLPVGNKVLATRSTKRYRFFTVRTAEGEREWRFKRGQVMNLQERRTA